LTTKGSETIVKVSQEMAPKLSKEELKWEGPTDERYEGIEDELNILDRVHCNDQE